MKGEILCEVCKQPIEMIGPFASRKPEGQSVQKNEAKHKYQCVNYDCENVGKVLEIGTSAEEEYLANLNKICKCGHTKNMHMQGLSRIEDGQPIPTFKNDAPCRAECGCQKFTPAE